MANTCALVTLEVNDGCLYASSVYRPRGVPNSRDSSQTGITITAPSRN